MAMEMVRIEKRRSARVYLSLLDILDHLWLLRSDILTSYFEWPTWFKQIDLLTLPNSKGKALAYSLDLRVRKTERDEERVGGSLLFWVNHKELKLTGIYIYSTQSFSQLFAVSNMNPLSPFIYDAGKIFS